MKWINLLPLLLFGFAIYLVAMLLALKKFGAFKQQPLTLAKGRRYQLGNPVLSEAEKTFFLALSHAVYPDWVVFPKMRIADLISVVAGLSFGERQAAFNRIAKKHVDFVVCDSRTLSIVGVVELDDSSHSRPDRIERDRFVDEALGEAGIRVLHVKCQASYSIPQTREAILKGFGVGASGRR